MKYKLTKLENVFGDSFIKSKMEYLESRLTCELPIKKKEEDWLIDLYFNLREEK